MIDRQPPSDLVTAIINALEGEAVTATVGSTSMGFTLHAGEDDVDPTIGTQTGADGAFSVVLTWGETASRTPATGLTFSPISRWRWPVTVRISYDVSAVRPDVRMGARPQIEQAVIDAIRGAVEPVTGYSWAIVAGSMRIDTMRHPQRSAMYLVTVQFAVEGWY